MGITHAKRHQACDIGLPEAPKQPALHEGLSAKIPLDSERIRPILSK